MRAIALRDPGAVRRRYESISAVLKDAVRERPDAVALVVPHQGAVWSYSELGAQVDRLTRELSGLGVRHSDRVAAMLSNRAEYAALWFAVARLGAVLVPVNLRFRRRDAGHIVRHSGSKVAICEAATRTVLDEVAKDLDHEFTLVDLDETRPGTSTQSLPPPAHADALMSLQYTSGTTGLPKGCMLSQRYWLTLAEKNTLEVPGLGTDDVVLSAQPFSYMDPQWSLISAVSAQGRFVLLDSFHPSSFWRSVREEHATFFYCLGVMPRMLLKMPPSQDEQAHDLRMICCSGIPKDEHRQLVDRFGVNWLETYGMTEIGTGAAVRPEEAEAFIGSGVVGRATRLRDLRVVDAQGVTAPRGTAGELVVRGVGVMDGYYRHPEATAAAFMSGWFHTGDIVTMDGDGYVRFAGRKKDMIRRSGENISAVEVEQVLEQHPAVLLAACVAVPDDLRGEEVKACVTIADAAESAVVVEELPAHCERLLATFKVPRYWELREELPLTASSKIAKGQLLASGAASPTGWDRVDGTWR